MLEAFELLEKEGIHLNGLRLRAFPFADVVEEFIHDQDLVFVVEQNRDAQMRTLLINELEIDPAHLIKVLHYDGTPITARFIHAAIRDRLEQSDSPKKTSKKSKELA
jgi:2-oxoglutarate ferredoxin oxidoreductase subunit alpha